MVISDWDIPGLLYGEAARKCTREEISREVWAQMQEHVNKNGELVLDYSVVHSWYLDEAITESEDGLHNDDPFLENSAGSWDLRPEASTAAANLLLVADYVRTYSNVDFAIMEDSERGRAPRRHGPAHRGGHLGAAGSDLRRIRTAGVHACEGRRSRELGAGPAARPR